MMVTCPCCQGKKRLMQIEPAMAPEDMERLGMVGAIVTYPECCYCQGDGEIEAGNDGSEVEPMLRFTEPAIPPGLRKHELTRAAKKDHLLALRMAPDDVEKLLNELYPPEEEGPT